MEKKILQDLLSIYLAWDKNPTGETFYGKNCGAVKGTETQI